VSATAATMGAQTPQRPHFVSVSLKEVLEATAEEAA